MLFFLKLKAIEYKYRISYIKIKIIVDHIEKIVIEN